MITNASICYGQDLTPVPELSELFIGNNPPMLLNWITYIDTPGRDIINGYNVLSGETVNKCIIRYDTELYIVTRQLTQDHTTETESVRDSIWPISISPDDRKLLLFYYDVIETAPKNYIYETKTWDGGPYKDEEDKGYLYLPWDVKEKHFKKYIAVYFLETKELKMIKEGDIPVAEWRGSDTLYYYEQIMDKNGMEIKDTDGRVMKKRFYYNLITNIEKTGYLTHGYPSTDKEDILASEYGLDPTQVYPTSGNYRIAIWYVNKVWPEKEGEYAKNTLLVFDRKKQEFIFTFQQYWTQVKALTYTGKYVYISVHKLSPVNDYGKMGEKEDIKYYVLELPVED